MFNYHRNSVCTFTSSVSRLDMRSEGVGYRLNIIGGIGKVIGNGGKTGRSHIAESGCPVTGHPCRVINRYIISPFTGGIDGIGVGYIECRIAVIAQDLIGGNLYFGLGIDLNFNYQRNSVCTFASPVTRINVRSESVGYRLNIIGGVCKIIGNCRGPVDVRSLRPPAQSPVTPAG